LAIADENDFFLPHDAMPVLPMPSCGVCPSVRHVCGHIFNLFSLLDSHTILVFPYQTSWQYSNRDPPNRGRQMQVGSAKITIVSQYLCLLRAVNGSATKCNTRNCNGPWPVDDTNRW